MILELVKKASALGLTTLMDCKDNILSIELVDSDDNSWYSYEATDYVDVFTTVNEFLTNPLGFTQKAIASISSEIIEVHV